MFYLKDNGKVDYDGYVTQKDADELIIEWEEKYISYK